MRSSIVAPLGIVMALALTGCQPAAESSVATNEPPPPRNVIPTPPPAENAPPPTNGAPPPANAAELAKPKPDNRVVGVYAIVVTEEAKRAMAAGLTDLENQARMQGRSEAEIQATINEFRKNMTAAMESVRLNLKADGTFTASALDPASGQSGTNGGIYHVEGNTVTFVARQNGQIDPTAGFVLTYDPETKTLSGLQNNQKVTFKRL